MVAAYFLINVVDYRTDLTPERLEQVRAVEGVETAHAVSGPYDIIARVEASSIDEIAVIKLAVEHLDRIQKAVVTIVWNL